jgi:hypothetical protein
MNATKPYRTLSVGPRDPYYGGSLAWSCPCGALDHGMLMVRHGADAYHCSTCKTTIDRAELDDFYAKGPLYRQARATFFK